MSSKLDAVQIIRETFDAATSSSKVNIVNAEIAVELNADDGDTIVNLRNTTTFTLTSGQVLNTSRVSRIAVYSADGAAAVTLVAKIGAVEISIGTLALNTIREIALPELKITFTATQPVYLVTQS